MLKRVLTTTGSLLALAACGESPLQPSFETDRSATATAIADRISICHLDADTGTYVPLTINGRAESAHRRHGDGQEGDPVPGAGGAVFGEDCAPVLSDPGACLTAVTAAYGNFYDPWSWSDSGPWSVSRDEQGLIVVRGRDRARVDVSTAYCQIFGPSGAALLLWGDFAEEFSSTRAFLLALTSG